MNFRRVCQYRWRNTQTSGENYPSLIPKAHTTFFGIKINEDVLKVQKIRKLVKFSDQIVTVSLNYFPLMYRFMWLVGLTFTVILP